MESKSNRIRGDFMEGDDRPGLRPLPLSGVFTFHAVRLCFRLANIGLYSFIKSRRDYCLHVVGSKVLHQFHGWVLKCWTQ